LFQDYSDTNRTFVGSEDTVLYSQYKPPMSSDSQLAVRNL